VFYLRFRVKDGLKKDVERRNVVEKSPCRGVNGGLQLGVLLALGGLLGSASSD
jgi:hypothetical protein